MSSIDEMHLERPDEPAHERFNYRGHHRYLVTLPTFGDRASLADVAVVMPVLQTLREACERNQFDVYAYCFLPDRLVMITRGKSDEADFRALLQDFRASSGAAFEASRGHSLWSKKFQERVLRKEEVTKDTALELFSLPVKAGIVRRPHDYELLGSFVTTVREILPPPERRGGVGERIPGREDTDRRREPREGTHGSFRPRPRNDSGAGTWRSGGAPDRRGGDDRGKKQGYQGKRQSDSRPGGFGKDRRSGSQGNYGGQGGRWQGFDRDRRQGPQGGFGNSGSRREGPVRENRPGSRGGFGKSGGWREGFNRDRQQGPRRDFGPSGSRREGGGKDRRQGPPRKSGPGRFRKGPRRGGAE